jgi:hypothetical protein
MNEKALHLAVEPASLLPTMTFPNARGRTLSGILLCLSLLTLEWCSTAASLKALTEVGRWPGFNRGVAINVQLAGDYAYVGLLEAGGGSIAIIDIRDPTNSFYAGGYDESDRSFDLALRFKIDGKYAYVINDQRGLEIIDVSDPRQCVQVGGYQTPDRLTEIFSVSEGSAYCRDNRGELVVINVSDPERCSRLGGINLYPNDVAVQGDFAFLVNGTGLHVLEISNPASIVRIGGYPGIYQAIEVSGNYAYLGTPDEFRDKIVNISNPTNCSLVVQAWWSFARDTVVEGNLAYIANEDRGIKIFDVTNPASPILRGSCSTDWAAGVAVRGQHVYVADSYAGFKVFDVSGLGGWQLVYGAPIAAVDLGGSTSKIELDGNNAFVADGFGGFHALDVSDPAKCTSLGNYSMNLESEGGRIWDVKLVGNYAYLAGDEGLIVLDTSNPRKLVEVGFYELDMDEEEATFYRLAISGEYIYALYSGGSFPPYLGGGLQILRVNNATNLSRVSNVESLEAREIAVSGDYAYIAGATGLQIFNLSPTNFVQIGGIYNGGAAYDVAVSGTYAYLANAGGGLQIIDVSNPANCFQVGGYTNGAVFTGITVSGNYAYAIATRTDWTHGYKTFPALHVIDVSNPSNCVLAATFDTTSNPRRHAVDVTVAGGRIYVAAGESGVVVIPTLPDFQLGLRINGISGTPFTLEATTNLSTLNPWTPLLTTNVTTMPFDFVDYDVKLSEKPQKFYRVRQP